MLRTVLGLAVALAASSADARAEDAATDAGRGEYDVKLTLSAPSTRGAWTVRVTNGGDVPVRIAADARVLTLDVTPRGARSPVRCELPDDMRPEGGDLERPLVLPPGRSYAETFEARLYCFGETKGGALAPGSIVVARLGWTGKHPRSFAVQPLDGVEPRIAARGAIEAPPIVLPDEPTAPFAPRGAYPPSGGSAASETSPSTDAPALAVSGGGWVDADSVSGIEVPVTLRNGGSHAVAVRFQPQVLRFDLVGPGGVDHCTWPVPLSAPTREQFTTVGPGASTSLVATLLSYCDSHSFDREGVYFVRARVDTRNTSGSAVGLPAFEGELVAIEPTVLRLHRGRAPAPLPRPKLEER